MHVWIFFFWLFCWIEWRLVIFLVDLSAWIQFWIEINDCVCLEHNATIFIGNFVNSKQMCWTSNATLSDNDHNTSMIAFLSITLIFYGYTLRLHNRKNINTHTHTEREKLNIESFIYFYSLSQSICRILCLWRFDKILVFLWIWGKMSFEMWQCRFQTNFNASLS